MPQRASGAHRPAENSINFGFLRSHDALLVRLGSLAELHALWDPNSSLLKSRQLAEALLQAAAARAGVEAGPEGSQLWLIRTLEDEGLLGAELADVFHAIRKSGNAAAHRFTGTSSDAVAVLRLVRTAAVWFHQTFVDAGFRPGAFVSPQPTGDPAAELRAAVERLRSELETARRDA